MHSIWIYDVDTKNESAKNDSFGFAVCSKHPQIVMSQFEAPKFATKYSLLFIPNERELAHSWVAGDLFSTMLLG